MKKLIPSILIVCAMLSACQMKEQHTPVQTPSTVKQYQPEITGRACVNGLSMIRVQLAPMSSSLQEADRATWMYEMKPTSMDTAGVHIHC